MADVDFFCPHCGKSLQIDARAIGLQVKCTDCRRTITVPNFSAPAQPFSAPAQPFGAPPPASAPPPRRPTSVTVFGIINMVFGGFALLCAPFNVFGLFVMADEMDPSPLYMGWLIFGAVVGVFAALALIAFGIGLMRCKRWARLGSIGYGIFAVLFGLLSLAVNIAALAMEAISPDSDAMPGFIGGMVGGVIGLIYPILLTIFMCRRPAVESCVD